MPRHLEVALIDVGGTLWPNSWPFRASDAEGRRQRLAAALVDFRPDEVDGLATDLIAGSLPGDEARGISTESQIAIQPSAEALIAGCLERQGMRCDEDVIRRVRRAMAIPIHDRFQPLPGALELLRTIHSLGMRTVIASNTYWRGPDSYWDDFRVLGMTEFIDHIVTSVDAGRLKPHPAVFEMARRWADVPAETCVVIGNREENDIAPALAVGMHAILVHPDDPKPAWSRADAIAADLFECARALRHMLEAD